MPIKGLTCKESRSAGALAVLGKLRKGGKKSGNKPGSDLDYFRFDTEDKELAQVMQNLYGKKPGHGFENGIRFFFPSDDFDACMPTTMAAYKGGSCYRLCDGESVTAERVTVDGKEGSRWVKYPLSKRPECRRQCDCTATGKLRILIPQFKRFGVVEVVVGALNDLEHVSKQVAEIQSRAEEHGAGLSKVPLILYRKPRAISTPKSVSRDGTRSSERARREKWLIEVSIAPEFFTQSMEAANRFAIAAASSYGETPQLPSVKAVLPATEEWSDEFGKRPDMSFQTSDTWKDVKIRFDRCRTDKEVYKAKSEALSHLGKTLPKSAASAIRQLADNSYQRILESGVKPLDADVIDVEAVPDVTSDRVAAVVKMAESTTQEVISISMALELDPQNLTEWSEVEFQSVRNRLFAFSKIFAAIFSSPDDAIASFKKFGKTQEYKDCPPSDDQKVWDEWNKFLTF